MNNYVIVPTGPLISIGAVSLIYRGTKTVNAPVDIPKRSLPTRMAHSFYIKVIPTPMHSKRLSKIMQFHLPIFVIGPEKRAPIANPIEQIVVIAVHHLRETVSSLTIQKSWFGSALKVYQPNKAEKGAYRVLKTPIA